MNPDASLSRYARVDRLYDLAEALRVRVRAFFSDHVEGSTGTTVIFGLVYLAFAGFVLSQQGEDYLKAGVRGPINAAGVIVSLLVVAGAATVTALLLRYRRPPRAVVTAGAATVGLALLFALLPALTAGHAPLTIFLSVLVSLFLDVVTVAVAATVALSV